MNKMSGIVLKLAREALLKNIALLDARFRAALGDWRRIDRIRGFGGANSPYEDFAPKLGRLFERVHLAFDHGSMALARDAYAALFVLLALKDDYGFAVTRPESVVICGEQVRYLRALGETSPAGQRAVQLLATKRHLHQSLWERCKLSLHSVLECRPMAPDERGEWLDELIRLLRQDREGDADGWLREAVKLRHGGDGLRDLARQENPWRPRAWLDWLETVSAQADPALLLPAAKEALGNIPEGLELRAIAADHLAQAAQALGDCESLLAARWEAYRAEPFPARLLDLREAAGRAKQQRVWMRRAVTHVCEPTSGSIPGPFVGGSGESEPVLFKEEKDYFTGTPTAGTEALALLLAGDWRKVFKRAREDICADWGGTSSARTVILPAIMAWLTGWSAQAPPANVATLLEAALALFDIPGEPPSGIGQRVRAALAETMPTWKHAPRVVEATIAKDCARLASTGVEAILQSQCLNPGNRAAVLAAAAAEVLRAQCSDKAATKFLHDLRAKHRAHREFSRELTLRRNQTRKVGILSSAKTTL